MDPNTSANSTAAEPPYEDWKRGIAEVLFGRMRLIVATTLILFAAAVAICVFLPPTYEAKVSILIRVKPTPIDPQSLQEQRLASGSLSKEDLTTELELLTSPAVIRQVVGVPEDAQPTAAQTKEIRRIYAVLSAEVVPASNVLAIRLRSRDSAWAERTLDRLIDRYLDFRARAFHPQGQMRFLQTHAASYRTELEAIEAKLVELCGATSVTLIDSEVRINLDLMQTLQRNINDLELQQTDNKQSILPLKLATNSKRTQYFAFLSLRAIDRISAKLIDLKAERLGLLRLYPVKHEKVRALDKVILIADQDLRSEAGQVLLTRQLELKSLKQRLAQMQLKVDALKRRNVALQGDATQINQLRRQAAILAINHKTFAQRAEEARLNQAIASTTFSDDVTVLSRAKSSATLVFPLVAPTLSIGLIVGILLGFGLALLFEFLDHTLRKPQDVAQHLGLPVLLSVPKV